MATLIFISFCVAKAFSGRCDENGHIQCCSGYEWNNFLGKCTKCRPGFYGINCSNACLLPYYGEGCQQECVCSEEEECNISIGCQKKSTTTATTKTTTAATNTTHFHTTGKRSITTSDHDSFKIYSVNIATYDDTTLEITRLSTKYITLPDSSTALFSPKNMLFIAIFVVGLILVTLFIVYLFRIICKRCSARQNVKCNDKGECPTTRLPESIHYEEIANVMTLTVDDRYAPLQQINMDQYGKPLAGTHENEMKSEKNIEQDTFLNPDIFSDSSETGSTDSKGYQLPLSSVRALTGQLMTANLIVVADTDNNKNNGDYLTVLN